MSETKTTLELQPGDRVVLPRKGVVRTVAEVKQSAMTNYRSKPIYFVTYTEGDTEQWSGGNSATAESTWPIEQT
jgi:hypothetical protein